MTRDPLSRALVEQAAGRLRPESLPGVATDALMRGLDCPALRELAGARPQELEANRALLAAAAGELGLVTPSPEEAHRFLVREIARQIVDGTVRPYEGARTIWSEYWHELGRPEELAEFVGLASEWEDLGLTGPLPARGLRDELEHRIIAAARALLDDRNR